MAHKTQIAPNQWSGGLSRDKGYCLFQSHLEGQAGGKELEQSIPIALISDSQLTHHGSMEGYQTGPHMDGHQEGCNVAVTQKDLRVFSYQIIMDLIKEPEGAVPSSGTKDGPDLRSLEHFVEVFKANLVLSCQVTVPFIHMGSHSNPKT